MFLPSLSGYSIENKSASDQINIGAIGINGMGWGNTLKALEVPGVNLVAVCDVDENVMKRRLNSEKGKSIKNKVNIIVNGASKTAIEKVKKAGGSITILQKKDITKDSK